MNGTPPTRRGLSTAIERWAGLGPYYAMFPVGFAFNVVQTYASRGDAVLDPFAGRASSVYAAAASGRTGYGIEINPVGWLYGRVKLKPASKQRVLARINEIADIARDVDDPTLDALPSFFRACYAPGVLRYLVTCRRELRWQNSIVDGTAMALLLVYLHGKAGQALSNQMRQGKAMSPDYSVAWWATKGYEPPELDPVAFLTPRIEWRYAKGTPDLEDGAVVLGDSTVALEQMRRSVAQRNRPRFKLLFTSPPYFSITNYHYDQWLRLWMLGGPSHPTKKGVGPWRGKFEAKDAYQTLLDTVFSGCVPLMQESAIVYVRADARPFTLGAILSSLRKAFPEKTVEIVRRPFGQSTQTALFGDTSPKPGEMDIILRPTTHSTCRQGL